MSFAIVRELRFLQKIMAKIFLPRLKNSYATDHEVTVEFREGLSTEQVVAEISQLQNPQVIIWYIGCYGLRKTGVQFYRDFLISPIFYQNPNSIFWLVDLTAWGAFKNQNCSITKSHSCCDIIEKFLDRRIKCLRSAEIFKKLKDLSRKDFSNYFKKALCRKFISKISWNFPNRNILVKEILPKDYFFVNPWRNHDVSKAYSMFQYLEGCLLIDEILTNENNLKEIQIVFALPNDELKYYKDEKESFRRDIEFLISKRSSSLGKISLNIRFLSFKYGSNSQERPYNAQGEVLKGANLTYEDVVGHMANQKGPYAKEH